MSFILNSLIENLESDVIVSETAVPTKGLRQVIFDLVNNHNETTPEVRQTSVETAYEVAERSLVASAGRNDETRKFLVLRDVTNFLVLASNGTSTRGIADNTDLLPITNPLSTAKHSLTAAGIRHARARWIAADPRIDDSVRPLVASAYAARPESAERVYLFAKVAAAGDLIPAEIKNDQHVVALLAAYNPYAGGNSRMARSLRAKAQRRDSKGQFATMGGGLRFYLKDLLGKIWSVIGRVVGSTPDGKLEVEFKNHPIITEDGIYEVDPEVAEALQGLTPAKLLNNLKGQNVDQTIAGIDLAELLKTRKDAPTGWALDPNYKKQNDSDPDKRYISEDGYIVDYYESYSGTKSDPAFAKQAEIDGGAVKAGIGENSKFAKGEPVYVLKRDAAIYKGEGETEVVARVQSWGQVQVAANGDEKAFDKAIDDAPDDLNQPAPATTEEYTAEDYLAAITAKSGVSVAKVDSVLAQIAADPTSKNVAIKSFVGNSKTPFADRIAEIAAAGDLEDITTKMMAVALNLPKTMESLKDAIVKIVDAAIELEDKDLKKAKASKGKKKTKDEVKAEIIKPAAEPAPSELDKIDEAKPAKAPKVKAIMPETAPEASKLIQNDPDLSIQFGMGIDPYVPLQDKSGFPEGVSDEPQFIADNFDKLALEGGMRLALGKGEVVVRLQMKDENGKNKGPAFNVEVDAVRDALQLQGVDTNKILADLAQPKADDSTDSIAELPMDFSGMNKVAPAQGSNAGGVYEDENGKQYYVKFPQSRLHGENEVLASALYKKAGIPVAEVKWGTLDGQDVTFSEMLPEAKQNLKDKLSDGTYLGEIQEGFAIDAWLANWDVAGTGFDNIVTSGGKPVRIDTGGALLFRAQGEPKGEAFDGQATELDTLVNGKNQYSAAVFGDMSEDDKAASAKKLLDISDEDIDNFVNANISDKAVADKLAATLKERKQSILKTYSLEGDNNGGTGQQPAGDTGPEGQGIVPEGVETQGGRPDGRGDSSGDKAWATLDKKVQPHARTKEFQDDGIPTPELYELDPKKDAAEFVAMMEKLKENNPYASSVYIYSEDEYKDMRLFATADGSAGFALKPDGDIVSVFVHGDSAHKGAAPSLLAQAIEMGGTKLDAFDTVLPKLYARAGFRPVSRVKWNDDYAPEGWSYETYANFNGGRPDVVAMVFDPERVGSTYNPAEGEYFDDYDAAIDARDKAVVSTSADETTGPAEPDQMDPLGDVPANPATPKLEGYTYAQNADGVWYPETALTSDDMYALRNGEVVPENFPFIARNTESGDVLFFDSNGTKRWGQYGAAGALVRRKKADGTYEYLITKRNDKAATDGGVWSVPGGAHDSKEDAANPSKTATRELMEEMGWKVPEGTEPTTFKHKVADDWAYDYAVVDVDNDIQPKLSKEITETKWVSADEFKAMQQNGEIHNALDAETLDKLLFMAGDNTEFNPVQLSDGKWWTPDFNEDGTQKAFRKDKASSLKKGDIVTVKGGTGERDVVVINDPVVDGDKVSFKVYNPTNEKTTDYTWEADSESSILSDNKSAQPLTVGQTVTPFVSQKSPRDMTDAELREALLAEYSQPKPKGRADGKIGMNMAPSAIQVEAKKRGISILDLAVPISAEPTPRKPKPQKKTVKVDEYGSLIVFEYDDGTYNANWGLNKAKIVPSVNDTFDVFVDSVQGEKKKATFKDAESAIAWVGDLVAEEEGNETNPVTNNNAGDASKGFPVHKGGFLKPATESQIDAINKMLDAKDISPERKQEIENILGKDELALGEAGVILNELKQAPTKPELLEESSKPELPAGQKTEIEVGGKKITQIVPENSSDSALFYDENGKAIGAVLPSKHKAGAYDTIVQPGGVETVAITSYYTKEAALEGFGQASVDNGTFNENPFGTKSEEVAPEAETANDQVIPDDDNNDLTPKDPTDILDPNLITDELLKKNPDFEVMPNGDIKIGETTQVMKIGGKSFKYEAFARRTKRERFYVYMLETDLTTGEQRVLKIGKEFHSFKALESRIDKAKAAIKGGNPRKFFNHDKKLIQKFTPISGAPEVDLTDGLLSYVNSEVGPKTPAELATALSSFFSDITNDNYTVSKEVLDKLASDSGLPSSFVDDVIAKMAENKAKAASALPDSFFEGKGVPKAPHVSYDGETIVKVGDSVDWTDQKTGKVYRGIVQSVIYKHNSKDYLYSDQMLVIFPELNAEQGYEANRQRWRVSSNLQVVDPGSPMSQPFNPKAKEKATQENVGTGETPEFVEPQKPVQPLQPAKNEGESAGPTQEQIIEWFGDTHVVKGDTVFNPKNGKTGVVVGNFVTSSGYKGFTIKYEDGSLQGIDNTDSEAFFAVQKVDPSTPVAEPVKTPTPQSDAAPEIQTSELGVKYVEIEGVKHPLYDFPHEVDTAAIGGQSTPKKWSELESGDLISVNDEWTHVVSAGYGDDGVFRIVTSKVNSDWTHTVKTISMDQKKAAFLDMQVTAVVKPEKPMVPGAVAIDPVVDPDAPADDEMLDNVHKIADKYVLVPGSDLAEAYKKFQIAYIMEPETLTHGKVSDLLQKLNMAIMNDDILPVKSEPIKDADELEGLVEKLEASFADTSIADQVHDAAQDASAANKNTVDSSVTDADPDYDGYPVKKIKFEDITIKGGKKAPFVNIKGKTKATDLKVGDIIREGTGYSTRYRQVVAVNVDGVRGRFTTRAIFNNDPNSGYSSDYWQKKQGQLSTTNGGNWNGYRVYRPSQLTMDSGYVQAPTSGSAQPVSATAEKVSGIPTMSTANEVISLGVDKKSEAGNAQFGLTGDIDGLPYSYLPGATSYGASFNPEAEWKNAFDEQKVKTSNNKYVITGAIVTSQDGLSTGIVTDTDKPSSTLSVTWVHGPAAGNKESGVPSNTVSDTGSWMSPSTAKSIGVEVNADKIKQGTDKIQAKIDEIKANYGPQIEAKKVQIAEQLENEKKAKEAAAAAKKLADEIKAKKDAATVKGSGAEIVDVVPVIGWDESAYPEMPSLQTALDESTNKTGIEGVFGQEVLVDSDSIEDNVVAVGAVEKNGKPVTKLTFGLTAWTLDDGAGGEPGFLASLLTNPDVKKFDGIKIAQINHVDGKMSQVTGKAVDGYYVGGGYGYTYVITLKDADGNTIGTASIFRAKDGTDTPEFIGKSTSSINGPLAFHNKVEVMFDDIATPEQIETALRAVGVTQARPATTIDTQVMLENRIISLFGDLPDGSKNLTGEARQQVLDAVKDQYGFTAADMKPRNDHGVIHFMAPKESAEKLASSLNFTNLFHGFEPPSSVNQAEWMYNEMFGNGSGGSRSAADRALNGIYTVPGSGDQDIFNVGGAYIFTNKTTSDTSGSHVGSDRKFKFVLDVPSVISRLGMYGNDGDYWGKLNGNQFKTLGESHLKEVMIKGEVLYTDLKGIQVRYDKDRNAIIAYFQSKGVSEINGIPLAQFFVKM